MAATAKVRELQYSLENCMFNENPSGSLGELEGIYLAGKSLGRIPISREPAPNEGAKNLGERFVKSSPMMNISVDPNFRKTPI